MSFELIVLPVGAKDPASVVFHASPTEFSLFLELTEAAGLPGFARVEAPMVKVDPTRAVGNWEQPLTLFTVPKGHTLTISDLSVFKDAGDTTPLYKVVLATYLRFALEGDTVAFTPHPDRPLKPMAVQASSGVLAQGVPHCVKCGTPNEYQVHGFTCWKCSRP